MSNLAVLAGIAGIHILAIASPGPTLAAVLSHAVHGNRRAGFQLALGVVLATTVWATAAAAGLHTALASVPTLYHALQWAGAAYLIHLGVRMLAAAFRPAAARHDEAPRRSISGWQAVRAGFLTNITNPKVIAYYASLFGVLIPSTAPVWLFWASVATVIAVSGLWWSGATLLLTQELVRRAYRRFQPKFDVLMGVALIALAVKLITLG